MKYIITEGNSTINKYKKGEIDEERIAIFDTFEEAKEYFNNNKIDIRKSASPIFWRDGVHYMSVYEATFNEEHEIYEDEYKINFEKGAILHYCEDKNGELK